MHLLVFVKQIKVHYTNLADVLYGFFELLSDGFIIHYRPCELIDCGELQTKISNRQDVTFHVKEVF